MHLPALGVLAALVASSSLAPPQWSDKPSVPEVAAPANTQAKQPAVLPWADAEALAALAERHGELRGQRARQGAWTRVIDQIHHDEPGDGSLWVRGRTYKAQVSPAGFTFVPFLGSEAPRNWPLSLQLVSASVGELDLPLEPSARVTREGDTLALDHGPLREELHCTLDAIEQVFVIERLPARGELELSLTVDSDLVGEIDGDGLIFRGPQGSVGYGGLTVFDAAGRSIELPSRIEQGRIVLRVPATFVESAELPLVVDPLVWLLAVEFGGVYAFGPDVAWDSATGKYLVTWEEVFSASDSDVNTGFFGADGSVGTTAYVDLSNKAWRAPVVANNALSSAFLVVAQVDLIDIRGRIRFAWDGMDSEFQISPISSFIKWAPSVGGDASAVGPTYFLVVWEEAFQNGSDHDIYGQRVTGNGSLAGGTITLDSSGGTYDGYPRVSKTNGHPPFDKQGWNITWGRNPDAALKVQSLVYMQIRWDGQVLTPSTVKPLGGKMSIFDHYASPPLDGPPGAERMFVLLHATDYGTGPQLMSDLKKGSGLWVTFQNLGADFSGLFGQGTIFSPMIDTDGAALVVGFAHTDTTGGTISRVASVRPSSLNSPYPVLEVSEAPFGLQYFFAPSHRVGLSLQHAGAATGPLAFCAYEQAGNIGGAVYELRDRVIGSLECAGNPTSTGTPAHLTIVGSRMAAQNRVYLEAWDLPPSNLGIFIMSQSTANIPFGQGVLCLGSPVYRFQVPKNSGAQGFASLQVNLNSAAGAPPIVAGQTWRFQYWTRDGNQVNFSNSARVTFQ